MANQAIALQARAPRGNILGPALQQGAQMVNMMRQQEALDRQTAATNQQLALAQAEETHKAAMRPLQVDQAKATLAATQGGEERTAALQPFALSEAQAKAQQAQMKTLTDFFALTILGLENSKSLDDAVKVGNFLKENFKEPVFQQAVDQTMATLPKNPADFEPWREQTMFQAMNREKQLSQTVREQSLGNERRLVTSPTYTGGPRGNVATEIPGSRVRVQPTPKAPSAAPVRRSSAASGRPRAANSGKANAPLTAVLIEEIAP